MDLNCRYFYFRFWILADNWVNNFELKIREKWVDGSEIKKRILSRNDIDTSLHLKYTSLVNYRSYLEKLKSTAMECLKTLKYTGINIKNNFNGKEQNTF